MSVSVRVRLWQISSKGYFMHLKYENALITGAAGFIGFHLSKRLLEAGCRVFGVDNLNDYYDPKLKQDRLDMLKVYPAFTIF